MERLLQDSIVMDMENEFSEFACGESSQPERCDREEHFGVFEHQSSWANHTKEGTGPKDRKAKKRGQVMSLYKREEEPSWRRP